MKTRLIQLLLAALAEKTGRKELDPVYIDGIIGPKTNAAVDAFWAAFGTVDGGLSDEVIINAISHALCYGLPDAEPEEDIVIPPAQYPAQEADIYFHKDGFYRIPRGVDVQLSRNLRASEIHCQGKGCCTESKISKRIVEIFQKIRDDIGEPLEIGTAGGSGYRCEPHNAEVNGAGNSLHLLSEAVDIHYRDPARLKAVAKKYVADGEIGTYSWGCHVGAWDRGYVSEFTGNG